MLNQFKRCPFCNESISADASKCRYCYEWVEEKKDFRENVANVAKKIDFNKKHFISFLIVAVVFIFSVGFLGYKAVDLVLGSESKSVCNFNNIKTEDNYIFRITDDPSKDLSDFIVSKDKKDCKYYLNLAKNNKIELDTELQEKLLKELENTDLDNAKEVALNESEKLNKLNITLDVVTDDKNVLNEFLAEIDKIRPNTFLTINLLGGNENNLISQDQFSIKYTSPEIKMYKRTFDRQQENVIYVLNTEVSEKIIDESLIESNNLEFIKTKIKDFYTASRNNDEYNKKKYLIAYLDYLGKNAVEDVKYMIFTDGEFERVDYKYYNFNTNHFRYHLRRMSERLKLIEEAREKEKQGENVEIPRRLPQFYTYFNKTLKQNLNSFKDACFVITRSEDERDLDWLKEKDRLYEEYVCSK